MSKFRFVGIQLEVGADKAANIARAVAEIRRARHELNAQVVALPEMFCCPYDTSLFAAYSEPLKGGAVSEALSGVARECGCFVIGGSFPERGEDGKLYNSCPCFSPTGELVAVHRKVHLFKISAAGVLRFDESTVLGAGNEPTSFETPWGCRIGVGICFDVRFPEYARILAVEKHCSLLVYPGAFNNLTGPAHWDLLLRARAVDNQAFVAGIAPAREPKASYQSWGHSRLVNPWGDAVGLLDDDKPGMFFADIDPGNLDSTRATIPVIACRRIDLYQITWKQ